MGHCGTSEKHSTNLAVTVLCTVVSFRDSSEGDFCRTVQTWGWGGRASEAIHHPVQRLADARVLVADLQRGRQKPQISREAEQCACSPCQLFGSSLSQLCSNSTSRCLTGCSCYEVGQLRQRGGEAARRRWRGNGKRRQCVFARVLRQCAKDLANLCRL